MGVSGELGEMLTVDCRLMCPMKSLVRWIRCCRGSVETILMGEEREQVFIEAAEKFTRYFA